METAQRATVAFLCGYLNDRSGSSHSGIYDFAQGIFVPCSYTNIGGNVSVFDYKRSCYLSGRFPSFYDYGVYQYVSITQINDNLYNVFDFNTSLNLSVTCRGGHITVFDYQKGQYFNYQLN